MVRYMNGSLKGGSRYKTTQSEDAIEGYVTANYVENMDTRKSLFQYVLILFGIATCWKATLQLVVALSTTQAEYITIAKDVMEAIWLK